ncbi:MAG: DUF2628 domain-containing protein [Alphaproteobacteria bacterium]|nr:DUF2628 domain-containing protein [Alphaproteobacteria bacterium]
MRYYTVHLPWALSQGVPAEGDRAAGAGQALGGALFVREGFNWLAFLFSIPWAIGHGLWLGALIMAAALAMIVGVPEIFALDWGSRAVLLIGYALFCGFNGNDWLRLGLAQDGWDLVSVIAARSHSHAVMRLARLLSSEDDGGASSRAAAPPPPRLDIGPSPGFWS